MEIFNRIDEILEPNQKLIIFEFGGNYGTDSYKIYEILKSKTSDFTFYIFEPVPRFATILRHMFDGDTRVKIIEAAIGLTDSVVPLYVSGNKSGTPEILYDSSSSIRRPKLATEIWPNMNFIESNTTCITLDSFAKSENIQTIDFIWSDIQGAELDMILGGKHSFSNIVKYLYTEAIDDELYEDQIGTNIINHLPNWEIVEHYQYDMLLKNNNING